MKWLALVLCAPALAQVPYQRIANAPQEPGNWLTYSGNYQGHRYSPLSQVTPANVAGLRVKWAYQFPDRRTEVSPIVVDGVMYVSGPNTAAALDARTGRELWTWRRPIPDDYHSIGFGRVNRGVAVLDDQVFVATLDCYLVALDAKSGLERWSTKVEDYKLGYSMTLAPLAIRDKVLIGTSGGEAGIRGFVDAYDAKTGARAWRFLTIPGPGEPGHETWSGEAWKTGGGSTWVTGSYDPDLNLVYWGVGNPGPDWNGDARPGDNLYTCSVVALDGATGKLKWHFQFTPHDSHDWDSTHVPVLFEAEIRGARRKLLAIANRNAFYYVLDRASGEFLAGGSTRGRPGPRVSTIGDARSSSPARSPARRARWSGRISTARPSGSAPPSARGPACSTSRPARSRRCISSGRRITNPEHFSPAAEKRPPRASKAPARSARWKRPPAACDGSSSCTRRRGRACWRPPAAWSFRGPTKATSTRWTPPLANRSGIFRPAARSRRTPCPSPSTASSTSPSPPIACYTSSDFRGRADPAAFRYFFRACATISLTRAIRAGA